ncbi:hypothetical protein [Streptomyces bobili]|uniref:hypothetical protein n=1 Tax=Streptomyces bobili TaxID=67280 RepID=UPI003712AEAC
MSRTPHRLEQGVQRVQQAASVQQHRARLSGRCHRERDEAEVGVGQDELHRQVVGDPQLHAVAQGIDRVVDDARLRQYGAVQHGSESHSAVQSHGLGRVLVGRQGDERRRDEGADLRPGRVLDLQEPVTDGVDARDDLDQVVDAAPGHRRPVFLGEGHQCVLGHAKPVPALADERAERHGRRRGGEPLVRRPGHQPPPDQAGQGFLHSGP